MSFGFPQGTLSYAGGPTDPNWSSVVLLAGGENGVDAGTTFDDASNSNHTLTAIGNWQWDTAQAPTGQTSSMLGDGTGDRLEVADNADWYFTGSVTFETWVRWNTSVSNTMFITQSPGGTGNSWQWFLEGTTMYLGHDTGAQQNSAAWSPVADTWYAIAAEWNGTNVSFYVDGTRIGQGVNNPFNIDLTHKLTVGARGEGVYTLNGWQGPTRITKGVARMNGAASYTVPTLPLPTS